MKKLIKWRVSEKPTGSYASFHYRAWPQAYVGEKSVVQITTIKQGLGNSEGYDPYNAKTGNHAPLRVMVRYPVDTTNPDGDWVWRYLKGEFPTLSAAKMAAEQFWAKYPELLPKPK